jgi:K+-transporting ATPase A subunit
MGKIKEIKNSLSKIVTAIAIPGLMISNTVTTAYAKKDGAKYSITTKFTDLFNDIRGDLVIFSSAAAGVCVVICLLTLLFTKNERATQTAWDWLKRIIICYVAIMSITAIMSFIGDFAISE